LATRTEHAPGTFSWADLATSDPESAKSFYSGLLGWEVEDTPAGDTTYSLCRVAGKQVCALYGSEQPPAWLAYVTVEQGDAAAARAKELGGSAISEPFDVLEYGRMAVLRDPQGAVFAVWEPRQSIGAELVNDPGAICMTQLNTSDPGAAERFYGGLFGWRTEKLDAPGPDFWSVYNGDTLNAGMMALAPGQGTPPHWLVYFTTTELDRAADRILEGGGRLLVEPMAVPAGRIAVARDPQGAAFGLFEGEVDP
jgi:predicted enzyme related to lactoylglutathione lyase